MKYCPFCSSPLQENARFCLHCMKELDTKKPIDIPKKKRPVGILVAICTLLIIGTAVICLVFLPGNGKSEPKGNAAEEETPDNNIITSFEDYSLRCTYLTGKNSLSHLWDANSFINTHTGKDDDGDTWEIYSPDVHIPGANFSACFCENGEEIITALTGITSETFEDAAALLECSVFSVYNYSYDDLYDFLTNRDRYPLTPDESKNCVLTLAGLPDGAGAKCDVGSEPALSYTVSRLNGEKGAEILYYQFRTRMFEGKEVFDIILLHTREE